MDQEVNKISMSAIVIALVSVIFIATMTNMPKIVSLMVPATTQPTTQTTPVDNSGLDDGSPTGTAKK